MSFRRSWRTEKEEEDRIWCEEGKEEGSREVMYGSPPSKDLNLPHPAADPFGGRRAEDPEPVLRRRQQQEQQMNSSLLRYRSAPSSLLGEVCAGEDFDPDRGSSPETETMFARFLVPDLRDEDRDKASGGSAAPAHGGPHFPPPPSEVSGQQGGGFPSAPQMMFHPHPQQQMPSRSSVETSFPAAVVSLAMETDQFKNTSAASNLIRQSSSPAGLFPHLTVDNGYGMMRGFMVDGARRLRGELSFSSRQSSVMSQISEMENEEMEGSSPKEEDGTTGSRRGGRAYISGLPVSSWDDSSLFSNSFLGLKAGRDGLNSLEPPQDGEVRNHALGLPHHLSLPTKNSSPPVMTSIEKFLQFHDAVPCKIRAKRGCATHPRSIAERVRRTRISERMKKLQDLVPNMDKQTNTADMLDLAVDYIKDLQKQVKSLSESRASCSCSATRQKPY